MTFGIAWGIRLFIPHVGEPVAGSTCASSFGWFMGGGSLLALAWAGRELQPPYLSVGRLFRAVTIALAVGGGLLLVPVAQAQRFADPDLRNLVRNPLRVSVGEYERVFPCLAIQPQCSLEQGGNLVAGLPHQFNTRSVAGYCFSLPWQGWMPFMGLQGQITSFDLLHQMVFDPRHKGLLGLLRVGAIVIAADDTVSRKLLEAHPDFMLQESTEELLVYRHSGFRHPAWFVEEFVSVRPAPLPLHLIDTAHVAVAWDSQQKDSTARKFQAGNRVISFREQHATIDLTVDCPQEGLLVINNTFYPGWEATIDDRPQPLGMVDAGFMGVPVPTGATRVSLRYRPRWLIGLLIFSTLAWLSLSAVFVIKILPWLFRDWRANVEDALRIHG
jgi:hypothetical protein